MVRPENCHNCQNRWNWEGGNWHSAANLVVYPAKSFYRKGRYGRKVKTQELAFLKSVNVSGLSADC
jgi:hypothetical protein